MAADLVEPVGPDAPDEVVFAVRSNLVHEWRKFLFRDPGLPAELLPDRWPGTQAAELFDVESARLLPAASRFVDCCLPPPAAGPGRQSGNLVEGPCSSRAVIQPLPRKAERGSLAGGTQ